MIAISRPVDSPGGHVPATPYSSCDMAILYASGVDDDREEPSFSELVGKARAGDQIAWRVIVARVKNVAWKRINGFHLAPADADDAFAATMLRLADNLDQIREPERLPGWVATTARNECIALIRMRQRAVPVAEVFDAVGDAGDHDRQLVLDELQEAVRSSFVQLSQRCQQLLRLLTVEPPMPYHDIVESLGIPHGSIGPTRRRCLETLRSLPPLSDYLEGGRGDE